MAMTPAQKMYNRGARAAFGPNDLSHWDSKLGHMGNLYTRAWLDGYSDAAAGQNNYRSVWFDGAPDPETGKRYDGNAEVIAEDTSLTERLESIRVSLRAESVSYGELAELASLVEHIDPDDAELLEAAGVPEHTSDLDINVYSDEVYGEPIDPDVPHAHIAVYRTYLRANGLVYIDTTSEPLATAHFPRPPQMSEDNWLSSEAARESREWLNRTFGEHGARRILQTINVAALRQN
jgi:hypothetical protein